MKSKILIDDFEKLHTEIRKQREENNINLDNDNIEICLITSIYNACNNLFNNKFSTALNLVQKLAPKYHNDPIIVSNWINEKVEKYTGIKESIKPIEAKDNFEEKVYNELSKNYPCVIGAYSEDLQEIPGHTVNIFGMNDKYYYIFENGKNSVLVNMMIQNVIDKFDLSGKYNKGFEDFINKFKIEKSLEIANDICWNYIESIGYVKKYKEKYDMIHENMFNEIDAPIIYVINDDLFKNLSKLNGITYSDKKQGYLHKLRFGDSMIDTNIRNFSEENSHELILKMTKRLQDKLRKRTHFSKLTKRLNKINYV